MQWRPCPACGKTTGWELRPAGSVFMHGPYAGDGCMGAEVSEDEAQSIRRMREEGGDRFRLAAHP